MTSKPTDSQHNNNGRVVVGLMGLLVGSVIQAINTTNSQTTKTTTEQKTRPFREPIIWATIGIFVATAVSVVVGIAQWRALSNTDEATRVAAEAAKQAAEIANRTLIASQRGWIFLKRIWISSPLTFDKNGASTTVAFEISNVGQIPASNVMPNAWLGILKNGGGFPLGEQQRRCNEIRHQPFGLGFTLFPGETFPNSVGIGSWSQGVNVNREELEEGRLVSKSGKEVALFIIGCIDYTFATDSHQHHQTEFIYDLRANAPHSISPDDLLIPAADLYLSEFGPGGGKNAD